MSPEKIIQATLDASYPEVSDVIDNLEAGGYLIIQKPVWTEVDYPMGPGRECSLQGRAGRVILHARQVASDFMLTSAVDAEGYLTALKDRMTHDYGHELAKVLGLVPDEPLTVPEWLGGA